MSGVSRNSAGRCIASLRGPWPSCVMGAQAGKIVLGSSYGSETYPSLERSVRLSRIVGLESLVSIAEGLIALINACRMASQRRLSKSWRGLICVANVLRDVPEGSGLPRVKPGYRSRLTG